VPGGSLGFDPFVHQGFPAPQPFYAAPQPLYQPQPRPVTRPVTQQRSRPAPIAVPRQPEPMAVSAESVELPSPEQLGIHLTEPPVVVPAPETLGIRLD
jgi:hypothetical protein